MAARRINKNLKKLEAKCQMLEGQCSEHIRALEKTNYRLENEIKEHQRTESKLQKNDYTYISNSYFFYKTVR